MAFKMFKPTPLSSAASAAEDKGGGSIVQNKPESIWSRAFALTCLAEFLGYAQHAVLQPTFPLYITHLGGSPVIVGLVIASFGVLSVLSRPILGYWADR